MSSKNATNQPVLAGSEVWAAIAHTVPLVTGLVAKGDSGFISLAVKYRAEYDFLAVAKRYNNDGRVDVIFGSGTDFVGSLLGLEAAIEDDKWRPDKWLNG